MTTAVYINMEGKVALVTGGAYGMGRASALRFAGCGASVVVADTDVDRGMETVELIGDAGGEGVFTRADVSLAEDVEAMAAFIHETYGGLDYAHNNAGIIGPQDSVVKYPLAQWELLLRNNLTSVFLCMKAELPMMLARGGGAIVNVASETTYKGNVGDVAYTASKHGVVGLTTVAGLQYAKRGIRVNAICPGNVETGIMESARQFLTPEQLHHMETAQPIGRLGQPAEIAELVVWLCSDAAILVNAAKIAADSGWHVA
jgi:NAD(P)-dependent dehydrogenase (short-subunit alcohol dehydrogenase family)